MDSDRSPSPELHAGAQWRYAKGCRCWAGSRPDGSPGCREAWREYRRDRERTYRFKKIRARKLEEARQLLREAGELP